MAIIDRTYRYGEVEFRIVSTLVRRANTTKEMDEFDCLLSTHNGAENIALAAETFEFRMGTGHRRTKLGKRLPYRPSVHDWNTSVVPGPKAFDLIYCLASDYMLTRNMPRDDIAAMNYLAREGLVDANNPGGVLEMVRGLRTSADKVDRLLSRTGIDAVTFCEKIYLEG